MTGDPWGPSPDNRPLDRPLLSRDAIVRQAREVLVSDGLSGLSLRGLAGHLGVTAPALYAHMRDKRDLLQAVADAELEVLIDRFHAAGAGTDPIECIRRHGRAYVDYAIENPRLFCALFLLQPEITSEPWEGQRPLTSKAFEVAGEPIHRAIATGQLRAIDPQLAAATMWSVMHGVAAFLVSGPPLPRPVVNELADTAIDAAIEGLRAPAA